MKRQQPKLVRPWARVDAIVLTYDLSRAALRTYVALRTYANSQQDTVHPTVARLAERTGASERTIQRGLRELESFGLVITDGRGGRRYPNRYLLPDPSVSSRRQLSRAAAARAERVTAPSPQKGDRSGTERVTGLAGKGDRQGILLNQIKGDSTRHPEETRGETKEETKEETSVSRPAKRPKQGAPASTLPEEPEATRQRYVDGRYGRLVAPGG